MLKFQFEIVFALHMLSGGSAFASDHLNYILASVCIFSVCALGAQIRTIFVCRIVLRKKNNERCYLNVFFFSPV